MPPHEDKQVPVHIDKKLYKLDSPATGTILYSTGAVRTGYDLYREVPGQGDDVLVPNDSTLITLVNGMHFFSIQQAVTPGTK